MNAEKMIPWVYSLASGVQAKLFGVSRYDKIEKEMEKWINWIAGCEKGKKWECWQDCWVEYQQYLEK